MSNRKKKKRKLNLEQEYIEPKIEIIQYDPNEPIYCTCRFFYYL
jgi:hypothetical protein